MRAAYAARRLPTPFLSADRCRLIKRAISLSEISTDDCARLIASLRAKGLAAKTIAGVLVPLGRVLAPIHSLAARGEGLGYAWRPSRVQEVSLPAWPGLARHLTKT